MLLARAARLAAAPTVVLAARKKDASAPPPQPRVLQLSFAPPKDAYFVAGTLSVEHHMKPINMVQQHILGIVPPAGELRTVVRHSKDASTGKVSWLRLFCGGESTFETIWTLDGDGAPASERFAGVVDIDQRLDVSSPDGRGVHATLRHVATSVRGLAPLPVSLMETRCDMSDFSADGKGYHLRVHVTLASMPMVSYSGRLRECEGPPSGFLTKREAEALGLAAA